ncbi:hypothetical protein Emed_003178 [Eimeria media]
MAPRSRRLYAVEDILAVKRVKGKFLYRIRWRGYSEADDTWEGAECFTSAARSHFRPRMDALKQLWLRSEANGRKSSKAAARSRASPTAKRRKATSRIEKAQKTTKARNGKGVESVGKEGVVSEWQPNTGICDAVSSWRTLVDLCGTPRQPQVQPLLCSLCREVGAKWSGGKEAVQQGGTTEASKVARSVARSRSCLPLGTG